MSQKAIEMKMSQKMIIFVIGIIITAGIIVRLVFSHFELPLNSDNLQYFLYAIDHSLGESVNSFGVHNTGWPIFLSFFFSIFNSNNFMDFMALQKIISIVISSLTAIPIYILGIRFFSKELSLLGASLFVFEPRIIQNSTFGISDPLYIIGITIAIVLLLSSKRHIEFFAFMILGLSIGVRSEGLFLIPAFVLIYFWSKKISKENIIKLLISILILSLIVSVIAIHRVLENPNDGIFSRVVSGIDEIHSSPETKLSGGAINLLFEGIINFIKFLGWSQIPIWLIFVPAGFMILLFSKNKDKKIIFTLLVFISIPILYGLSFVNEIRYFFPLYPIFSLLSLFFINKINTNKIKFSKIKIGIIIGLIFSSCLFLIWKDIDLEKEVQINNLIRDIEDNKKIVNNFGYESSYVIPVVLERSDIFPITSNEVQMKSMKVVNIPRLNSLEEFSEFGINNGLTHWVIKEKNAYSFLDDIYKNENKYPFLLKEYDSENNGYDIHLKIFKVDYERYKITKSELEN